MEIFNFNFKPTLFKELRDEVNDNKKQRKHSFKISLSIYTTN